jgi:hypothetical protein
MKKRSAVCSASQLADDGSVTMISETPTEGLLMSKKSIAKPQSQIEPKSSRVLSDSELDGVSGGLLQGSLSNAIKSIGEGLQAIAMKQ